MKFGDSKSSYALEEDRANSLNRTLGIFHVGYFVSEMFHMWQSKDLAVAKNP